MQIKISNFKFIILLFVCVSGLFGQVNEEFSGATFNQSGYWSGTLDHYITNAQGQGQLNAPDGGTSYFSTPITWQDSTQFSHYIKMNFPPSDANRLSIYLLNENADLNIGNGLFLAIGEDGADDGVTLKYGTQNDALPIAEAGNGQFAGIVEGTFKGLVTQGHLLIEFQKPDQTIITIYDGARPDEFTMGFPTHFGFWMTYTVTRKDQFYFDDINIQKVVADNMGPVAKSIVATGLNTFIITFDEEIESTGLINPANFKITNGNSVPISINSIEVQGLNLLITTNEPLNINPNTIMISNLQDLIGNTMIPQSIQFSYNVVEGAQQFDILINELLPDPTPQIGLPNGEFIELFNNSNKTLQLSDYKLLKSTTLYSLPDKTFEPDTYLILVPNSDTGLWSAYANVVGLTSFPTLNNDGITLSLIDEDENVIHRVNYDLNSYKDVAKRDGGWSLEHTIPDGVCDGSDVFAASTDVTGGTPGRANTNMTLASSILEISTISMIDNMTVDICFSKTLDLSDPAIINIIKGVNTPSFTIEYESSISNCLTLNFSAVLEDGVWYQVTINPELQNCRGANLIIDTIIGFGQGFAKPLQGEVLVNEILFNPNSGGFDFVEFYNITNKIFDLNGLIIANTLGNKTVVISKTTFIQPGEYLVFCQDKIWLQNNYIVANPNSVHEMILPSFNDDEGNVTLWNNDIMVDSFRYDEKMHSVFLSDEEGISLERISETVSSTLSSNWQSAATDIGGGTPTAKNSQARTIVSTDKILSKSEEHFSPNQDGFLDQFIVKYHLDKSGYVLRWRVFDAYGRSIKTDNTGILTGTDGFITWDGSTDDNTRALPGIFVIEFQFTHSDGSNRKEKISCVLTYPK